MLKPRPVVALMLLVGAHAPAAAQNLLYTLDEQTVFGGDDLDGDGFSDVLSAGKVFSGVDGTLLYDLVDVLPLTFRTDLMDDLDGDGVRDLVIGAGSPVDTPAHFVSGADGTLIGVSQWPTCPFERLIEVAGGGDVDGDGVPDAAWAKYFEFGSDQWSLGLTRGATLDFAMIYDSCGNGPRQFSAVEIVADLSGDGLADVVFNRWSNGSFLGAEIVTAAGGTPIALRTLPDGFQFLESIPDRNGDGQPELVGSLPGAAFSVLSGADDAVLFAVDVQGAPVGLVGDVDCDGFEDLMTHDTDADLAQLWSGLDGRELWRLPSLDNNLFSVADVGDVDGDGVPDFATASFVDRLQVWSGLGPTVTAYCTGKATSAGCTPNVDEFGQPTSSGPDDFLITTRNSLVNRPGLFFFGTSGRLAVPFLGGTLCVQPALTRGPVLLSQGPADCLAGYAFLFSQSYAQAQGIAGGDTVNGQFWMRDPGQADGTGVALSDAIEFEWCE